MGEMRVKDERTTMWKIIQRGCECGDFFVVAAAYFFWCFIP